MSENNSNVSVKSVLTTALYTYVFVQAGRGWYALGKSVKEAIQDKCNAKK